MEIIVTHRNADFDALAAQVGASILFPKALRVMAGGLPRSVKNFVTLHRDHLELIPVKSIDQSLVTRMVVVDVSNRGRLKDYQPLLTRIDANDPSLEYRVYDHHGVTSDSLTGPTVTIEPVGAATTVLVEAIREAGLFPSPIEATALALGIYADTGSLTYASTTLRDTEAAAFCVAHGASLPTMHYFLYQPLNPEQLKVFMDIMSDVISVELNSLTFGFTSVVLERSIPGLSELVNKALMLQGNDATVAFFEKGSTVNVIGRARVPTVDIGRVMQELGGGGHDGAGSATIKNSSVEEAKARFIAALEKNPPKPRFVRDVMSTPVFTLAPDQILADVQAILVNRKFSGAPVVGNGTLKGVLSKRDIAQAVGDGRGHLPVSSCMSNNVKTISPDRSLFKAAEVMAENGIGRLPVVEGDRLIGLITRNDLLSILYPN